MNLYWKAADGTGAADRLSEAEWLQVANAFTPDGRRLLFFSEGGFHVLTMDDPSESPVGTESRATNGVLSPDGRWLAYQFAGEVHVRPFPKVDEGRWQISRSGGSRPVWGPDGRELFFLSPNGEMMAVPVRTEPGFAPGNAEVLFAGDYFSGSPTRAYDVSPDGERFLMLKLDESGETFQVVLNWVEELKRLVPAES